MYASHHTAIGVALTTKAVKNKYAGDPTPTGVSSISSAVSAKDLAALKVKDLF